MHKNLGPNTLNILSLHLFTTRGADLAVRIVFGLFAASLPWTARGKFAALRNWISHLGI